MRIFPCRRVPLALLALSVALGACASGGGGSSPSRSSSARLTAAELEVDASQDLYTVIQRRRPQWLQNRAPSTAQGRQQISVILDGVRQQGSVEVLRSMRAGDVEEVRFLNARDATTRYGTDMTAGAIEVVTKR
jgi:hypothetical protein